MAAGGESAGTATERGRDLKLVTWTDENGYKHQSLLRDNDPDTDAPNGILQDPPDLNALDWEGIKRDIHNLLLDRGLITWRDVQASHNGVTAVIQTVMKRRMAELYKLQEVDR